MRIYYLQDIFASEIGGGERMKSKEGSDKALMKLVEVVTAGGDNCGPNIASPSYCHGS